MTGYLNRPDATAEMLDDEGWLRTGDIATVTAAPAAATGLSDRGRIEPGLRGDVIRVTRVAGAVAVRGVWVAGERAA